MNLFTLSPTGSVFAAELEGKVARVEREGRYFTVRCKDGKEARIRIGGSSTIYQGLGIPLKPGSAIRQ